MSDDARPPEAPRGTTLAPEPAMAGPYGSAASAALPGQPTDLVYETGLELEARSQWAFARRRFLRHRLAMTSLVLLLVIFAMGIFANFVAPYSFSSIDINALSIKP